MEYPAQQYALNRISTIDALIDSISRSILDGNFEAGSQLREAELAAQYKVSRNSIREAFLALIKQGLIRREPNRGVFIPIISSADVDDLYRTRAIFEIEAARQAANETDINIELVKAAEAFDSLTQNSPWSKIVEADVHFHQALVESLHSPRISSLYENILAEFRLCSGQSRSPVYSLEQTKKVHQDIINAIISHKSAEAATLIQDHLQFSSQEHQKDMAQKK